MRTTLTKKLADLTLYNLLTVDTHGVNIDILDNPTARPYRLIPNNQSFFGLNGLYADVEKNSLTVLSSTKKEKIDLYELLRQLNANENSSLVLIEGFAGCGKSTLVQYILSYELKTFSYEYCFYNYDLEAQNDLIVRDEFGCKIRESSIFEAIKISFLEQFCKVVKENRNVLSEFSCLLEKCKGFQEFKRLYNDFYLTDTYNDVCKDILDDFEKNEITIYKNLKDQLAQIKGASELLALDYLLRLAMYKSGSIEKLYICYDNLDAIEDAEDLKQFNDSLIRFREVIDNFIISLQYSNYFGKLNKPHFIILATFRKITAIVAQVANTLYKEVNVDYLAGNENNDEFFYNHYSDKKRKNIETIKSKLDQVKEWCGEVRFISDQRLIRTFYRSSDEPHTVDVIQELPQRLKTQISKVSEEYSRVANRLDSSYPKRLFAAREGIKNSAEYQACLDVANEKFKKLNIYNLVDMTIIDEKNYNPQYSTALKIYFDDFSQKYKVFQDLVSKLDLFTRIINSRLTFKHLQISSENGFVVVDDDDPSKPMQLSQLSSGEKQEIVLFYELIFDTEENLLLLIDEPEISLHITWQKQFLDDLLEVSKQIDLQIIVATHSPQIVSNHLDIQIDLGELYGK